MNAASDFWGELPWRMMENSQFCVKGVLKEVGQMTVTLMPDLDEWHVNVYIEFWWVEPFFSID